MKGTKLFKARAYLSWLSCNQQLRRHVICLKILSFRFNNVPQGILELANCQLQVLTTPSDFSPDRGLSVPEANKVCIDVDSRLVCLILHTYAFGK